MRYLFKFEILYCVLFKISITLKIKKVEIYIPCTDNNEIEVKDCGYRSISKNNVSCTFYAKLSDVHELYICNKEYSQENKILSTVNNNNNSSINGNYWSINRDVRIVEINNQEEYKLVELETFMKDNDVNVVSRDVIDKTIYNKSCSNFFTK